MRRALLRAAVCGGLTIASLPAFAADAALDQAAADAPREGVPCGAPIVQSFASVWQGRFQGGYAHYVGEGGPVVLDWRQERLCFPDRGSCRRYIADMRHDFHRPEGYFTCLPIR